MGARRPDGRAETRQAVQGKWPHKRWRYQRSLETSTLHPRAVLTNVCLHGLQYRSRLKMPGRVRILDG